MHAVVVRAAMLLAASATLPLAGCGPSAGATANIVAVGETGALFDADRNDAYPALLVHAATAEGLVAFDPQGRVIPALADRWIVLDDGQSYIFRLRDGTWADGRPLTAQSAQVALRQAIAGLSGSSLGLDLAVIDDIRVMAGRVIEIRLSQPMPDLLQLLAQPELGLVYRRHTAGPMQLERAGDIAELVPIDPAKLGLPEVSNWSQRVRKLRLTAMHGELAVARFSRGDADLMLGGRAQQFPLTGMLGISRGTIQLDPVSGLFGLRVVRGEGVLAEAGNREAIAMAIDRAALIGAFAIGGWSASTEIVPPGVEDDPGVVGERWTGATLDERRQRARTTIARWRAEHVAERTRRSNRPRSRSPAPARAPAPAPAAQLPPLRIALPAGPGADLIFGRLQQDLAAIGLTAERVGADDPADLTLVDEVARYPRTAWYLNYFNCRLGRGLCDAGADALMDQVRVTGDPATRMRLLGEAEASLTSANVFIPLAAPVRWSLVRGDAIGFATNRLGWHPLMPMALKPR